MAKGPKKPKAKEVSRRRKKKVSVLTQEGISYVDWKDINLLRRFMSDRAKIRARQVTGNNQQQQQEIARAIKNAREMALLPYNNRITTQRSSSRSRDDSRFEGPVPQPSAPPPGMRPPGEEDDAEMATDEAGAPIEAVDQPVAEQPAAEQLAVEQPAAEQPAAEQLAVEQPAAEQPAAEAAAPEATEEEPVS